MPDFTARIKAELDTSGIDAKLKSISNKKIELSNITISNTNFAQTIQSELDKHQFDIKINNVDFKGFQAQVARAGTQAANTISSSLNNIKVDTSGQISNLVSMLGKIGLNTGSIDIVKNKLDSLNVAITKITHATDKNGNLKLTVNGIDDIGRAVTIVEQFNNKTQTMQTVSRSVSQSFTEAASGAKQFSASLEKAQNAINTNSLEASLSSIKTAFQQIGADGPKLLKESVSKDIAELERLRSEMVKANTGGNTQALVNGYEQFNATLGRVQNNLRILNNEAKGASNALKAQKLSNDIESWMNKNARAAEVYREQLDNLRQRLSDVAASGEGTSRIAAEFAKIQSEAKAAGLATSGFATSLRNVVLQVAGLTSVAMIIRKVISEIKQLATTSIEINTAMNQLQIVTGATDAQMSQFLSTATELANNLGNSIKDVLSSMETFARLGYSLGESSILAEQAGVLSNVAAVSQDEATTGLTSIIKGYQLNVEDASHVSDVLVEVGQNYAISAGELMTAFEKSGAALNATGLSFEKSAGLLAAANASVQNASTVGTALKTVSARMRKSEAELAELGESTDDLADGFSKYAAEIQALSGVDIMVEGTTDTFRDLYDIFNDISQVWDELTNTQQARLSEIFGGTRQLQVISSILGNWQDSIAAYESAMDSMGAATTANDKYMESTAAHIEQLKVAYQSLAQSEMTQDFMNFFVDAGKAIIEVIDKIGLLKTSLAAISGIGIFKLIQNAGGLKKVIGKQYCPLQPRGCFA